MRAVLLPAVALTLALAAPASAIEVSSAELGELASEASVSEEALARLRAVTSVDGRPVDLSRALEGASPSELRGRLQILSGPEGLAPETEVERARTQADEILAQDRFSEPSVPRPFAGLLAALGRLLHPVTSALAQGLGWLTARVPGGESTLWIVLGAIVAALSAAVSLRILSRRTRAARSEPGDTAGAIPANPRELERAAAEAERAGDHGRAVRLRFRAGLLRLGAAEAIAWRPSLTSAEVARALGSSSFSELARSFDEIVYGGRPARHEDAERSRASWGRLLDEVRR